MASDEPLSEYEPEFYDTRALNMIGPTYDVKIQFYFAEGLPKMDLFSHVDPYFIANIDNQISFKSTIIPNEPNPVWDDEKWIVRNIPSTAKLTVKLYDKDDDKVMDDYIGQFEVDDIIHYESPTNGHRINGPLKFHKGNFHLSIDVEESTEETKQLPPYTFDGPCRYSRHDSIAVGRITKLNINAVYSTWKIHLKRIPVFFKPEERQSWNKKYKAAQNIFGHLPHSLATKHSLKIAHKALYGRTMRNNQRGQVNTVNDLWNIVFSDSNTNEIKPCIYTYIIDDSTWRFSETGAEFFTDIASKHALLANASEHVRYAGEFHPRPKYGWDRRDDEWELVFDNGSGTYSPTADLLINLKQLLLFNFPGLNVVTYDYKDPELKQSVAELKEILGRT